MSNSKESVHQSVLLEETVAYLTKTETKTDKTFQESQSVPSESKQKLGPELWIDLTLGGGGHTQRLLNYLKKRHAVVWAIDQDILAIERARKLFSEEILSNRLRLFHTEFSNSEFWNEVKNHGGVLGILADLGFSSDQMDTSDRGFSFMRSGPLDMRLNQNEGLPLYELLSKVEENELANILWTYGEERYSRRIAKKIIERRSEGKLPTITDELAELIRGCYPVQERQGRIHAATRSFQALRIWVNDELVNLEKMLIEAPAALEVGGRLAVISFHSLEDRRVKTEFKKQENLGKFSRINKKVIEATDKEVELNPRSRSAKLRVLERISDTKKKTKNKYARQ